MSTRKVVICGAGFLGRNIAQALSAVETNRILLASRRPEKLHSALKPSLGASLLPAASVDITKPSSLTPAFSDAHAVVSLVGIMHGSEKQFEEVQWRGAENVAKAAKEVGAKLVHFSAIGANKESKIPYARTKALGEEAVLRVCPDATVIRPSLVFGKGDGFFARFATMSSFLPFMPVFAGGTTRFQPVHVGDIAKAVEICTRDDPEVRKFVDGKIIEAGGPDVFTYREMMQLVLKYTNRTRPIISLPFAVGMLQGLVFEQLPTNILTLTRAQVEQLKENNIVNPNPPSNQASFAEVIEKFHHCKLDSVHDILPTYL